MLRKILRPLDPIFGGTNPKPLDELETSFARHMRQSKSVQSARNAYIKKKEAGSPPPRPVKKRV